MVVESKMLSHQINFVGDYQKLVLKLRSQNFENQTEYDKDNLKKIKLCARAKLKSQV